MDQKKLIQYSVAYNEFMKGKDRTLNDFLEWMKTTEIGKQCWFDICILIIEATVIDTIGNKKEFICEQCKTKIWVETQLNVIPCQFGCEESVMMAVDEIEKEEDSDE